MSEKFQKLAKTISLLKKRREATLVSLNINDMRAEQEMIRAENKQYRIDQVNNKILVFKDAGGKFTKVDLPIADEASDSQGQKKKNKSLILEGVDDGGGSGNGDDGENDWPDSLRRNPYIDEAMNVLMDMNTPNL